MLEKDFTKLNANEIEIEYKISVREDVKESYLKIVDVILKDENKDDEKLERIPDAQRSITYAGEMFSDFCKKNGIKIPKFLYNYKVLPNRKFTVDVYVPELKLCIEYDGPHHKKELDEAKNKALKDAGFKVIRLRVNSLPKVRWAKNYFIGSVGARRKLQYKFLDIMIKEMKLTECFKKKYIDYKEILGKKTNLYKEFETVEERDLRQKQMFRLQIASTEATKILNHYLSLVGA